MSPIISGGMASANNLVDFQFSASGSLLSGGAIAGSASAALTGTGSLGLIISLSGEAIAEAAATGSLALTISLAGESSASLTGTGSLSMLVPMSGEALAQLTGYADLKGYCSLSGDITPYTELSPQNLAAAVWSSIADNYQETGTMGLLLNTAGGGGIDPALAQKIEEVWQLMGLDSGNPLSVSTTERLTGAIAQAIEESGGVVTVTRA